MAGMRPLGILGISNKTPNDARTPLGGTMSHILLLTNSTGTSVDVHVRRLRAKLGADHENLISTVRNVGYRLTLVRQPEDELTEA